MPQYAYLMESRLFPVFSGGDGARNCSQQPTKRRRKRPNPLEFDKPAPRLLLRLTACKCTTLRKRVWREERRCCREVWKEGADGRESATLWLVYTVMAGSPQCVDESTLPSALLHAHRTISTSNTQTSLHCLVRYSMASLYCVD